MTPRVEGHAAPSLPGGARGVLRWFCTSNPFYVVSAGLFLAGLWLSFGAKAGEVDTWALLSGLGGYTLLLAATAFLLVRFLGVWDDARTVLLLVVLMFLATSVTFDELLAANPAGGAPFYLGGLLLAVVVTEGLLRGIRLRLPAGFRVPYYLMLALFFLYPLALAPWQSTLAGESLLWGLFGFPAAAGLAFLTLLPAARRGPAYARGNGSPWPWPFYPWSLFVLLGLGVVARSVLMCQYLHLVEARSWGQMIFGLYFLVPLGLAATVVLLEIGLAPRGRGALAVALLAPVGLVALTLLDHRDDAVYTEFLQIFRERLGSYPALLTLWAAVGFYAYAAWRRVLWSGEGLTAALAALAFVSPNTLTLADLGTVRPEPILAAATLQLALGLRWRDAWRSLAGTAGLAAVVVLSFSGGRGEPSPSPYHGLVAYHLALAGVLAVGAAFDDLLGRTLRAGGAGLVLLACLVVTFGRTDLVLAFPKSALVLYPVVMAGLLAMYALVLRDRIALAAAAVALVAWLGAAAWQGYFELRQHVAGLDYLLLSLAVFGLALLISVAKSGALARWLRRPQLLELPAVPEEPPPNVDPGFDLNGAGPA